MYEKVFPPLFLEQLTSDSLAPFIQISCLRGLTDVQIGGKNFNPLEIHKRHENQDVNEF